MAKINRLLNVDTANTYGMNSSRMSTDNSFSSYLGESQSLDEIFDAAADKYQIPVELLKAVGKQESNFRPDAVSRCGAQGIMQLMPSTAKGLGVSDAFDPEQNIMGGAKYLSGLLKKYDGNVKYALAAYNAGSGNVAKYGGIPPFEETQTYVKKVIGYMKQAGTDTSGKYSDSNVTDNATDSNTVGKYLHVAPLSSPTQTSSNYSYLLNGNNCVDSIDDLATLFHYDDYMKFIDLFLNDNNEEDKGDNNYYTGDIKYSASVLNLLSDQGI